MKGFVGKPNGFVVTVSCLVNGNAGPSATGMKLSLDVHDADQIVCTFHNTNG